MLNQYLENSETNVIVLTDQWEMSEEYRSVTSHGLQTMMSLMILSSLTLLLDYTLLAIHIKVCSYFILFTGIAFTLIQENCINYPLI